MKAPRPALSHFSSNTNHDASTNQPQPNPSMKRKKNLVDDELSELEPEDDVMRDSGCDRVVCRECCIDGQSG